jgi:competence protein ComGC
MRTPWSKHRNDAFTALELLVVLAVIFVVGVSVLLVPNYLRSRQKASTIKCSSNLKQVALSFKMFAADNEQNFPFFTTNSHASQNQADAWIHFYALSNELGSARILVCPQDDVRSQALAYSFDASTNGLVHFKNRDISYFVSIDAKETAPDMVLAGDRNVFASSQTINGPLLEMTGTNLMQWNHRLHSKRGNAAMSDGSVVQATAHPAWKDNTNRVRLLLPNN